MPYSMDNVPGPAKNWTPEEQEKCIAAANAVLAEDKSDEAEQNAIFACIRAAGKTENPAEKSFAPDVTQTEAEIASKQAGPEYLGRMAEFIKEKYPSIWQLFDRSARGYAGGKAKAAKWQQMLQDMEAEAADEPMEKAAPTTDDVSTDAPINAEQHSCVCPECGAKMDSDKACSETPCPKCQAAMKDAPKGDVEKSEYAVIAKSDAPQQKVWAVVLEPGRVDAQGDWMTAQEVEKAAHRWLSEYGKHGLLHKGEQRDDIRPVESYISPVGFRMGEQNVPAGAWVLGVHIANEEIWKQVADGSLNGFSIQGWGKRRPKKLGGERG